MKDLQVYGDYTILDKSFSIYGTPENPLFLAKDVAEWIEYSKTSQGYYNVSKMLTTVDEDEKCTITNRNSGGKKVFLTEDGLYEVLMQSRKPIAKEFKKEVKKILKQIRLTGGTVIQGREEEFIEKYFPSFTEETKLAMTKDLYHQNQQFKQIIEEQKPMIEFANRVSDTTDLIDMGKMAKLLNDEHIPIGRNKLFGYLRSKKILMSNNVPYQKYVDNGYFKIKEKITTTAYGERTYTTTYVTGKGQIYITEKLREQYASHK